MSAWGFSIGPVPPDEPGGLARRIETMTCTNGLRCPGVHEEQGPYRPYRVGGQPVTHRAMYRYVSGRAGRVTHRVLWLCAPCAEKFTAKWCASGPSAGAGEQETA